MNRLLVLLLALTAVSAVQAQELSFRTSDGDFKTSTGTILDSSWRFEVGTLADSTKNMAFSSYSFSSLSSPVVYTVGSTPAIFGGGEGEIVLATPVPASTQLFGVIYSGSILSTTEAAIVELGTSGEFGSTLTTTTGSIISGGGIIFGSQSGINIHLAATASAVPEPSTYAAFAGVMAIGFAAYRRRKTAVAATADVDSE